MIPYSAPELLSVYFQGPSANPASDDANHPPTGNVRLNSDGGNVCARYPKAKAIADLSWRVPAFIPTETIDDHESIAIVIRSSRKIQCSLRLLFPVKGVSLPVVGF
jgi:hypothetical protein